MAEEAESRCLPGAQTHSCSATGEGLTSEPEGGVGAGRQSEARSCHRSRGSPRPSQHCALPRLALPQGQLSRLPVSYSCLCPDTP